MKYRVFIAITILLALVAACREHTLPAIHGHLRETGLSSDLHELPPGRYDALFNCESFPRSSAKSSGNGCDAYVDFFDDSGKRIRLPKDMLVRVNGDTIQKGFGERVKLNFPGPITWQVSGDGQYPSITHTIASDSSIEFLSPDSIDPTTIYSGFEVRYHAPHDIDTIGLLISYQGQGVYKRDTTNQIKWTGQDYWERAGNTGRYFVRPFVMDSRDFRSFDPQKLLVVIRWARGDTVHVGPYVYGFVNASGCSRRFNLKR